jgi:hypothetical protein
MGRRPLHGLEQRAVEDRDLARQRAYVLERTFPFLGNLNDETPGLASRERNSDDGADLYRAQELVRDSVPEAVVD